MCSASSRSNTEPSVVGSGLQGAALQSCIQAEQKLVVTSVASTLVKWMPEEAWSTGVPKSGCEFLLFSITRMTC